MNHDIEQGKKKQLKDSLCLKCLMFLDSCITCGFKLKEYVCCFCIFTIFIVLIVLGIFLKKCLDAGTHECLSSIVSAIKGNSTNIR